jgi:methionine-rich copper-binding protein CopC
MTCRSSRAAGEPTCSASHASRASPSIVSTTGAADGSCTGASTNRLFSATGRLAPATWAQTFAFATPTPSAAMAASILTRSPAPAIGRDSADRSALPPARRPGPSTCIEPAPPTIDATGKYLPIGSRPTNASNERTQLPTTSRCLGAGLDPVHTYGTAYAHAHLLQSDPAADAVATAAPDVLRLDFSEGIQLAFTGVTLHGPDGGIVPTGHARLAPKDDKEMLVPLPRVLTRGKYTVEWQALSKDGHCRHRLPDRADSLL